MWDHKQIEHILYNYDNITAIWYMLGGRMWFLSAIEMVGLQPAFLSNHC